MQSASRLPAEVLSQRLHLLPALPVVARHRRLVQRLSKLMDHVDTRVDRRRGTSLRCRAARRGRPPARHRAGGGLEGRSPARTKGAENVCPHEGRQRRAAKWSCHHESAPCESAADSRSCVV